MLEFLNAYILGPTVPLMLFSVGIYYSLSLRFFYIRHPIIMLRSMFSYKKGEGVSPFGAATVALAGTLGVGNIVGVASAIELGGAGALFWMWVSALCAMVLKYAETVLAMIYRKCENGKNIGGAMYYIREILGRGKLARALAALFCIFCIVNALGMGGMIQVSAAADVLFGVARIPKLTTGIVCAVLALFAVSSGMKKLSGVTEKLVPVMSVIYMVMAVVVIGKNVGKLPSVLVSVFEDAFSGSALSGGVFGFLFSRALRYGAMRGLLSNEAGCGTATIAYASSDEKSPARQGFWGIFEVFFDTIVLCTMTALVILVSYDDPYVFCGEPGVMLTVRAFSASLGDWAGYVLGAAVFLFAFATVICWAEYGLECVGYFSRARLGGTLYLSVYFVLIVLGSFAAPALVWGVTDLSLGVMTLINLFALSLLSGKVKKSTDEFFRARE